MPRDEESSLPPVLIAFVVIVLAVVGGGFLLQTKRQATQAAMAERDALEAVNKARIEEADKEEKKGIEGRWLAEKTVSSGIEKGMDEERLLVIDGESVSWTYTKKKGNTGKSSTINFTYKLDPSKKPAEIDLSPTEGDFKDQIFPGIYELDGDTLKLCRNQPGQKRPNEFVSNKGSDEVLLILKRVKSK
jgi:uncharacterized protein (TIGR03067 family)